MNAPIAGMCRKALCSNFIPDSLANEQMCLDHFLNDALLRTNETMQKFHDGSPITPELLERLLADALTVVNNLEEGATEIKPEERERLLELLLSLANLHEYAAHHSISLGPAS